MATSNLPLQGKTVVVTGLRSRERERMEKAVAQLGGTVPPPDAVLKREDPPVACVAGSVATARYAACASLLLPIPVPAVKPSWLRACLEAKKLVRLVGEIEREGEREREREQNVSHLGPPSDGRNQNVRFARCASRPRPLLKKKENRSRRRGTPWARSPASGSASRAAPARTRGRSPRPWRGPGRFIPRT